MEAIKKTIELLASKITTNSTAPESLNYSQAALNLAHTMQVLAQVKLSKP